MKTSPRPGFLLVFALILAACHLPQAQTDSPRPASPLPEAASTLTATPAPPSETPTPQPSATFTPLPSQTPSETATATPSQTPSETPSETPSPVPTYAILRGKVNADKVSCRYGPGAAYLYKYGLVGGSNLEIIHRLPDASWIEIRAIGGNNPCWMNAKYMDVKGDLLAVEPIDPKYILLPMSPYYGPLTGVSARRSGSQVTISWNEFILRAGDDSEQYRYLVEAWTCQGGQIVFQAIGTYDLAVNITDETGCSQPSEARVYGVEKHGYTLWVKVPWP